MYERLKAFFNGIATDPQKLADYHLDREHALEEAGLTEEEKEVFRLTTACPTCVTSIGGGGGNPIGNPIGDVMKFKEEVSREIHIHIHHK
jgi:hypothetical protein